MRFTKSTSISSSSPPTTSYPSASPSASLSSPKMLLLVGIAMAASVQPAAAMLSCDRVLADKHMFDFSKLRGPHSVVTTQHTPPTDQNTTYTLDLCGPLVRKGDVPKGEECPNGSWACAIKRWRAQDNSTGIGQVIPLAGSLKNHGGGDLEHTVTRLRTADSHSDVQKEGVRIVLNGGRYPLDAPASERRKQRVIIELLCDANREGTEGEWAVDEYVDGSEEEPKDDDQKEADDSEGSEEGDEGDEAAERSATSSPAAATLAITEPGEKQLVREDEPPALVFGGYDVHDADGEFGTLRLTWYTRYACENATGGGGGGGGGSASGWGFFTWFVIVIFLSTAAYLIFGSWLNYNRYGARGWDLLPHGDTLRDVPYLLQDWVRRLVNTLQGSGSRGGYSAV